MRSKLLILLMSLCLLSCEKVYINGDLDGLIDALVTADQAAKLAAQSEG